MFVCNFFTCYMGNIKVCWKSLHCETWKLDLGEDDTLLSLVESIFRFGIRVVFGLAIIR